MFAGQGSFGGWKVGRICFSPLEGGWLGFSPGDSSSEIPVGGETWGVELGGSPPVYQCTMAVNLKEFSYLSKMYGVRGKGTA